MFSRKEEHKKLKLMLGDRETQKHRETEGETERKTKRRCERELETEANRLIKWFGEFVPLECMVQ